MGTLAVTFLEDGQYEERKNKESKKLEWIRNRDHEWMNKLNESVLVNSPGGGVYVQIKWPPYLFT